MPVILKSNRGLVKIWFAWCISKSNFAVQAICNKEKHSKNKNSSNRPKFYTVKICWLVDELFHCTYWKTMLVQSSGYCVLNVTKKHDLVMNLIGTSFYMNASLHVFLLKAKPVKDFSTLNRFIKKLYQACPFVLLINKEAIWNVLSHFHYPSSHGFSKWQAMF